MANAWTSPDRGVNHIRVAANGLQFDIAEAGSGDHLALCLQGFQESNYSWRHQMQSIAELGYRVWAPNQRGYGGSSRPIGAGSYSIETLVADAAALFDVSRARKLTLIGHDWGAAIAWVFAINKVRPLERLVVMNLSHPLCMIDALKHWPQLRRSWYVAAAQIP